MPPPIRFTLESFEDVAGYPGKVFYVLHQYPGTGCPQVPFIAIDKTEEGDFKIRELDQSPVEEFKDGKYKYNWPRDPRLQWCSDETEEVVSSESLPPTDGKSSTMPIIQDVKSVDMDFFHKNKCTQGLMVSKDGQSTERNIASKNSPAESESGPKTLFQKALPLSPRIWKNFPVLKKVGDSVNQNASTSGTSSPVVVNDIVASKPAGFSKLVDMKLDNIPKKSIDIVNQNASTSRTSLPVIIDDGVASMKTGGSKLGDTKVSVAPNNSNNPVNQKASTSKTLLPGSVGDSVPSKENGSTVSVDAKVNDLSNNSIDTKHQYANTSKNLLPEVEDSMVGSEKAGGAVSVDTKIDDVPNKLTDTVIKKAGTSRSVFIDERLGKNGTVTPESGRECERSLPLLSCISDSPAPFTDKKLPETPLPPIESILASNKPTSDSIQKAEHGTVSFCETSSVNTVSFSPVDVAHIDCKPATSVTTVAETYSSSVKSGQPQIIPKEVAPRNTVVREISSLVSNILSEHVKSSNQPNDPNVNITDSSEPKTPTVMKTSETTSTKKDSSPDKLNAKVGALERSTPHKAVVKEISSIVTGIISGHMKSSSTSNSTKPKMNKSSTSWSSDHTSVTGDPQSGTNSSARSTSGSAHKVDSVNSREKTESRNKDQTDVTDKCTRKKSSETSCLPKNAELYLSDVDNLITRAKNFVRQKQTIYDKPVEKDVLFKKTDSGMGSAAEPRKTDSTQEQRKSKPVERGDVQKCETPRKKSTSSVSKKYDTGYEIDHHASVFRKRSPQISPEKISCSSKTNYIGNPSSSVVSRGRSIDADPVSASIEESSKQSSKLVRGPSDVYDFQSDDADDVSKRKTIVRRRNTVDGSDSESRVRTKSDPLKIIPYSVERYRKELKLQRTPKKTNLVKTFETQNVGEKPKDNGGAADSNTRPSSPVSKNMKSSIEDIFNLQAILTDDSSPCNYSGITLKGPVKVASNTSKDKAAASDDCLRPSSKEKNAKETSDEAVVTKSMNPKISEGSDKGSGKNPVEVAQNSEGNLSIYAEDLLERALECEPCSRSPVEAVLPKHDEDTKKKERKNKCLALMKERNLASDIESVEIDKGAADVSPKSITQEIREDPKYRPQTIGMHRLPAVVSSRGIQLKPVLMKKPCKNNCSNPGSNVESLSNAKVELERKDQSKTTCMNDPSENESHDKETLKTQKLKSKDNDQNEQLGSETAKKENIECSQSRISPLKEELSLKRQKKHEPSSKSFNETDSGPVEPSKTIALLDTKVTAPPVSTTSLKVCFPDSSIDDLPSKCPMYSDLPPVSKPLDEKSKKDVKKDIDSPISKVAKDKTYKDDCSTETDVKNKTESPKDLSKQNVSPKGSVDSPLRSKYGQLKRKSSNYDDRIKEVPPAVKVGSVEAKESVVDDTQLKTIGTITEKGSDVCADKPTTSSAIDVPPNTAKSIGAVAVSNLSCNAPSMTTFACVATDVIPTTESRKQILRQLTSKVTEEKLLSKTALSQEGLLGMVSIGSNDLIENKIKNVVEDIVKIKIEIQESEKKKSHPLSPPTADELVEYFSECFDNTPEKDPSFESDVEENNSLVLASTTDVPPASAKDSSVSNPNISEQTSGGKSDNRCDATEDKLGSILNGSENGHKTNDATVDQSIPNEVLQSKVSELGRTESSSSNKIHPIGENSKGSANLGSRDTSTVSPKKLVTVEINETDKNEGVPVIVEAAQKSSGTNPSNQNTPVTTVDDDVVDLSSQESSVEIVDVDGIQSSSVKSGFLNSRTVRKRRRVDELVPTISTLVKNRKVRGNRLVLFRKLVAQRFSVEPFSPKSKNRCLDKRKRVPSSVSTLTLDELPSVATKPSTEDVEPMVEVTKTELTKPVVEVVQPDIIKAAVEVANPIAKSEVTKPEVSKPEVAKPVVEPAKKNIIKPLVEVEKPFVVKSVDETKKPALSNSVDETRVEDSHTLTQNPVQGVIESDCKSAPEVAKTEIDIPGEVMKPGVVHPVVECTVPDVTSIVEITKPVVEVTKPPVEVTQPLMDVIEIEEDPLSQPADVVFVSEEENSPPIDRIPFLEDEEYPPRSVPLPLMTVRPLQMPKPIVTLSSTSRDDDDDVVMVEVTSSSGGNLLNTASNSSGRFPSKRPSPWKDEVPNRKKVCTVPSPILIPQGCAAVKPKIPPVVARVSPEPVTSTSPAAQTSTSQERASASPQGPSNEPSSSSVPKRPSGLSEKLQVAPSTSKNDKAVREKKTFKTDHRRLQTWRKEPKVKTARLDYIAPKNRHSTPSGQASEEGERSLSSSNKTSKEGSVRDHCSTLSSAKQGIRSTRDKKSLSQRTRHIEGLCSEHPEVSPAPRIRKQGGSHCSTPTEVSESEESSLRLKDSLPVAGSRKRQGPIFPSEDLISKDAAITSKSNKSLSHQECWNRPASKKIFKVDREEAAWRNHLEHGRRFLGRRLKRFSHSEISGPETPHSVKRYPGMRQARGSRHQGSHHSSTTCQNQDSAEAKKLRSSSCLSEGKPGESTQATVKKDRSSAPRGKGVTPGTPGHRKGERRKIEGGPSRQLRSTAHKSRSGLIRKGDT